MSTAPRLSTRPGPRALVLSVLALTLAAGVSACGSSSSKSGSSTSPSTSASAAPSSESTGGETSSGPNPCDLLTDQEASQFLGATATHQAPKNEFRGDICTWRAGTKFLTVAVYHGAAFFSPKQQAPDALTLPGVGDQAFVSKSIAGAIKGDVVVIVGGYGASDQLGEALRTAVSRVDG